MRFTSLLLVLGLGLALAGCSNTAKARRAATIDQSNITPTGDTVEVRTRCSVSAIDEDLFEEAVTRAVLSGLFRSIEAGDADYVLDARLAEAGSQKVTLGDFEGRVTISWSCRRSGEDEPFWRERVTGTYQNYGRDRSTMWDRADIAEDEALRMALQKSMEKLSRAIERNGELR